MTEVKRTRLFTTVRIADGDTIRVSDRYTGAVFLQHAHAGAPLIVDEVAIYAVADELGFARGYAGIVGKAG